MPDTLPRYRLGDLTMVASGLDDPTRPEAALVRRLAAGEATLEDAKAILAALDGPAAWSAGYATPAERSAVRRAARKLRRLLEAEAVRQIDQSRMAAGACRHCGGTVPCPSAFGDIRVGVRRRQAPSARR